MSTVRLIIDPPLSGAANMARDEALLEACRSPDVAPVLRFYAWRPETISLGYFQEYAEYEQLEPPAGGLAVVRRTTGGGAILHDLEVTYSLTLPLAHPLIAGRPNELYRIAHAAILQAVGGRLRLHGRGENGCGENSQRGPFFCFARRHELDLVVDDPDGIDGVSKLAGSAQRRTTTAVLQHGSILLDRRYLQQPAATWSQVAGPIDFDEAVERLTPAFESVMNMALFPDDWRAEERTAAVALEGRYAGRDWTVARQR